MGRMFRDPFFRTFSFLAIFALFFNPLFVSALGQKKVVSFERVDGSIDLVAKGKTASLLLDAKGIYILRSYSYFCFTLGAEYADMG